ncbi:MAG TPA: hypothetical protein VJ826_13200 [Candidatus Polarisedimenticolaceae bacterium]|nr:hypothetical protein [Candidatus Polarisedimenticolaceae bacterium]
MRARRAGAVAIAVALANLPSPFAQYGPPGGEVLPNNYPPPIPERLGPAPSLKFELAREIPLTGPIASPEAWAEGDAVLVPLGSGAARVDPSAAAPPQNGVSAEPPPDPSGAWIVSAEGTRRFRATAQGVIEAQKKRKNGTKWKRSWHIVAPNATPAPPILLGPRLCYAGLDDRVTCVKASNGHRLWTTDLGDRLSRPIARWPSASPARVAPGNGDRTIEGEILLAVPDNGASMIALDAYDGRRIATYDLPSEERLVSGPLVFADDGIVAVREAFDKTQVAVLVLRLVHNEAPPAAPAAPATPTGR